MAYQSEYYATGYDYVVWKRPHEDCGPNWIKADIVDSGQGIHLGNYTIVRSHSFDPATARFEDGYFEQTAASEDKVRGTYQASVKEVHEFAEENSPVVIVIDEPRMITGGIGRFSSAEGEGNMHGIVNLVTYQRDFVFEGRIS